MKDNNIVGGTDEYWNRLLDSYHLLQIRCLVCKRVILIPLPEDDKLKPVTYAGYQKGLDKTCLFCSTECLEKYRDDYVDMMTGKLAAEEAPEYLALPQTDRAWEDKEREEELFGKD